MFNSNVFINIFINSYYYLIFKGVASTPIRPNKGTPSVTPPPPPPPVLINPGSKKPANIFNIVNFGASTSKGAEHVVPFKPPQKVASIPLPTRLTPEGVARTAEWKRKQAEKAKEAEVSKQMSNTIQNLAAKSKALENDQVRIVFKRKVAPPG